MRHPTSTLLICALLVLASSCTEDEPPPEVLPREPPDGTLVYEGECARVFRSFDGYVCEGTSRRFDARACLLRDYLGGGPDVTRLEVYLAAKGSYIGDWCSNSYGGCEDELITYGYESVTNHEIVHAIVESIVGHHPHSIIDEGLAHVLDGSSNYMLASHDLEALLTANSGRTLGMESANFVGWILDNYGPEVALMIAKDVPLGGSRARLEASLVEHLGMPVQEIIAAYDAEAAWMYPELPSIDPPVRPQEWAGGIGMTLDCTEPNTQGISDTFYMWQTIDFEVEETGRYLFLLGDAEAMYFEGICETPYFEEGNAPCQNLGFVDYGLFAYVQIDLDAGRRYRAEVRKTYPGPVNFTFLPMLGVEP